MGDHLRACAVASMLLVVADAIDPGNPQSTRVDIEDIWSCKFMSKFSGSLSLSVSLGRRRK
jgi:hypothetical protein